MSDNNLHDPAITSLGRYWDESQQGRPADPGDLDPALAETVQRLHARDDAPGADAAFAARLLTQLEDQIAMKQLNTSDFFGPLRYVTFPGSLGQRARQRAPSSHRMWPFAQLASAALVVVTLVVAYLAFGPPRLDRKDEQWAGVPAMIATPATPASSTSEQGTLAAFTLPEGTLPSMVYSGQNHYTFPPGSRGTWDPSDFSATCCIGARLNYVLEGSYTVRGEGPMWVQRDGTGTQEEIPAGTEIVLEPGDALLSQMEHTFEAVNSGSTPVELLDGVLFEGNVSTDPIPQEQSGRPAWTYHDQDINQSPVPVPPGPLTLRLEKSTLAVGDVLLRPAGAVLQMAVSLDPDAIVLTDNPRNPNPFALSNLSQEPVEVYILILEPAALAE